MADKGKPAKQKQATHTAKKTGEGTAAKLAKLFFGKKDK